jgi:hypothetical protein
MLEGLLSSFSHDVKVIRPVSRRAQKVMVLCMLGKKWKVGKVKSKKIGSE